MSSINLAFGGEFTHPQHGDEDDETLLSHDQRPTSPSSSCNAPSSSCSIPQSLSSLDEVPSCQYSELPTVECTNDDDEGDEDSALVVRMPSHDSTKEEEEEEKAVEDSYVLVHKPEEEQAMDNLPDNEILPFGPDVDVMMGDGPLPVTSEDDNDAAGVYTDSSSSTALVVTDEVPSSSSFLVPTTTRQLPHGGLHNLGNTCYLNSALQMLASVDVFSTTLWEHVPEFSDSTLRQELLNVLERLNRGETVRPDLFKTQVDERSPLFVGYRQQDAHEFLTTLLDLLDEDYKKKPQEEEEEEQKEDEEMKDAEDKNEDNNDVMQAVEGDAPVKKQRLDAIEETPTEVVASPAEIPLLPSSGSFKDFQFEEIESLLHGDQVVSSTALTVSENKSHEGPKCKLIGGRMNTSGVHLTRWGDDDNLEASAGVMAISDDWNSSEASEDTKPYSPIDDVFTTTVRVCLTCDSCKYRRSHNETYLHLSLEIGPTINSIEEGIRAFFKPEKREVKCEKCFCETASQTTEITKLPQAMLFHLKRFIVDVSPDYSSISYRKDQSAISFAPTLPIDEHSGVLSEVVATNEIILPPNSQYAIRSVVNHIGSSASCGHYTADGIKKSKDNEEGSSWMRFNDQYVSKISESNAVDDSASTAYMVMYELETIEET